MAGFNPERAPQASQPSVEQPQLQVHEGGLAHSMSTQPEDVLRRATALLDGGAVTADVATFTQRILNSVNGQTTEQIAALAEQYARATHPAEGAPVPSAEMLQELALTAAILEGHVTEQQAVEASTIQTAVEPAPAGVAANTNPVTGEALTTGAVEMPGANDPVTPASESETSTALDDAEEAATVQMEQPAGEELEGMQARRTEILRDVFGLTEVGTLDDARKVAVALRQHGDKDKVETAMAELMSIEARLGNSAATVSDAALPDEPAAEETPAAQTEVPVIEEAMPAQEEPVTPETQPSVVDNRELPPAEPVDESEAATEIVTEVMEARPEESSVGIGEDGVENSLDVEQARDMIKADIVGLEKTMKMYKKYERDLANQFSTLDRYLPKFLMNEKKRRGLERLNDMQIAIAHVGEAIARFNASLVELENADEMFEDFLNEDPNMKI